jgi:hypothetical protein
MFHDIYGLAYGECAFRHAHPEQNWDRLLGESPTWRERHRWHRATHRAVRATAKAGVLGSFPKPESKMFLLRWLESCLFSPHRLGLAEILLRTRIRLQHMHCLLCRPANRAAAFTRWLESVARYATFRFHLDQPGRPHAQADVELPGPGTVSAEVLADQIPASFHPSEIWEGLPLAWSQPLVMLWLKLPPGSWHLRLELAPVLPAEKTEVPILWNGKILDPSRTHRKNDAITLRIRTQEDRATALSWATPPTHFPGDPRPLGLPVLALHVEAPEKKPITP